MSVMALCKGQVVCGFRVGATRDLVCWSESLTCYVLQRPMVQDKGLVTQAGKPCRSIPSEVWGSCRTLPCKCWLMGWFIQEARCA